MAQYELPTRLADGEQQSTIASIIGIQSEAVTNTEPIPRPPGGGAGRVNKFRRSNVQEYLNPSQRLVGTSRQSNPTVSEDLGQGESQAGRPITSNNGDDQVNTFRENNGQEFLGPNPVPTTISSHSGPTPSGQRIADLGERPTIPQSNPSPTGDSGHGSRGSTLPAAPGQQDDIELRSMIGEERPVVRQRTGGYSSLSSFMSSDKVFSIFRRFDNLSTRNLLFLQDELCELEEKLSDIDKADLESGTHDRLVSLHSRRYDANDARKVIMSQLKAKIGEYQEALDRHSRALALPKPASIYTDSLVNWMDGMKPVIEAESHFLDTPRDLVTLAPLGQGERNGVLENWIEKRWSRLFSTEKHRERPHAQQNSHVHYYSQTTIRRVVRSALTMIAVVILVAPIFALYYIQRPVIKLASIGVFSFCFAISLALWTKSSNHEIFAAMAAYCAVLVVFIGNPPAP